MSLSDKEMKMAKVCRKVRQSLFTKLAVVLIAGVLAINAVIMHLYANQRREHDDTLNQALIQYARDLTAQVGSPPDKSAAEELARQRPMRVIFSGKASWIVGETEKRFPEQFLQPRIVQDGIEIFNIHKNYRLRVRLAPDTTLTFDLFPTQADRSALRQFGIYSLIGSCIIMLAVYFALRFFLQPIGWLTDGASAVRDGNLETHVKEKGSGELRELTETFNQMTARLDTLVTGQRDLLLGVSHELRTPLTRLKLRLEMLETDADISAIKKDIRQMEAMITSLLETAKMHHDAGGIKARQTDITQLVAEAVEGYKDSVPGVSINIPDKTVIASVDPDKITMALNTLLDNAIKYSEADSPPVELSIQGKGKGFTITVKDYGIGIPQESISHLFEPFYRVDESRTRATGGYGLGLHLCNEIIKAHGAHIEVESSLGTGTTFRIVFQSSLVF